MGRRGEAWTPRVGNRRMVFTGARVPAAKSSASVATFSDVHADPRWCRISIGALAVGLAQAALDASIPYAQTREQFGRRSGRPGSCLHGRRHGDRDRGRPPVVWRSAWPRTRAATTGLAAPGQAVRIRGQLARNQRGYPGYAIWVRDRVSSGTVFRDAKLTEIGEGTSRSATRHRRTILGLRWSEAGGCRADRRKQFSRNIDSGWFQTKRNDRRITTKCGVCRRRADERGNGSDCG